MSKALVMEKSLEDFMEDYFNRYDLNKNGLIDSADALEQVTTNLLSNMHVNISEEAKSDAIATAGDVAASPLKFDQFCHWFAENLLEKHYTYDPEASEQATDWKQCYRWEEGLCEESLRASGDLSDFDETQFAQALSDATGCPIQIMKASPALLSKSQIIIAFRVPIADRLAVHSALAGTTVGGLELHYILAPLHPVIQEATAPPEADEAPKSDEEEAGHAEPQMGVQEEEERVIDYRTEEHPNIESWKRTKQILENGGDLSELSAGQGSTLSAAQRIKLDRAEHTAEEEVEPDPPKSPSSYKMPAWMVKHKRYQAAEAAANPGPAAPRSRNSSMGSPDGAQPAWMSRHHRTEQREDNVEASRSPRSPTSPRLAKGEDTAFMARARKQRREIEETETKGTETAPTRSPRSNGSNPRLAKGEEPAWMARIRNTHGHKRPEQ